MITPNVEELAKVYGIEINDVETGEGGLFYVNFEGRKEFLNDIFNSSDTNAGVRYESVTLENCSMYSTYSGMAFLMSNAA